MAKNREPEKPAISDSSPGEEEEETSTEEIGSSDSGSDSEQGNTQFLKKPSSGAVQSSSKSQQPPSSDDEDSGSDSDSDEPVPEVKPSDEPQKIAVVAKATPANPVGSKRPANGKESDAKDSKRSKKKAKPEPVSSMKQSIDNDSKKPLFQRLWSEDDEIVILEGMIEYTAKKRSDPAADMNAFHDFIKKNLHVDVTRAQLQDKIRRLRKKYQNNKNKDKTFSKPHEQKGYELSTSIWGNPNANMSAVKKTPKLTKNGETTEMKNVKVGNSNCESSGDMIVMAGAELLKGEKKEERERELRKLRVEEVGLYLKQLDLLRARMKLSLDALKSTDQRRNSIYNSRN